MVVSSFPPLLPLDWLKNTLQAHLNQYSTLCQHIFKNDPFPPPPQVFQTGIALTKIFIFSILYGLIMFKHILGVIKRQTKIHVLRVGVSISQQNYLGWDRWTSFNKCIYRKDVDFFMAKIQNHPQPVCK